MPTIECPKIEPRGVIIRTFERTGESILQHLPRDRDYCYLTKDGMGMEDLTMDQLFEIRRMLNSAKELRIEFHELHFKINEELSKL